MSKPAQSPAGAAEPRFAPRHHACIAVITMVAAALRLWQLGDWALWIDEAHTYRDATMPMGGEYGFANSDRALYPLTFLLLRGLLSLHWIGIDEASLRLPFVLLGIVTVPLMALLGRRLVGPNAAVFAAAILALHPWHVFWSQNARGYVIVVLATVVAVSRWRAWQVDGRFRDVLATGLAVAVGALSHPTAALLAVALVGYLLARWLFRGADAKQCVVRTAIVVLLVVGLPPLAKELLPFQAFLRSKAAPSVLHYAETVLYYFRPSQLLLSAVGLALLLRAPRRPGSLLLGCLFVVPFLVLLGIGGQVVKVTARYAICALPVVCWLVGAALARWTERLAARPAAQRAERLVVAWLLPLVVAAELVLLLAEYHGPQHGQRARWREAAAAVREAAGDAPMHVLTNSHPSLLYYLRPRHWVQSEPDPHPGIAVYALLEWHIDDDVRGAQPQAEPGAEAHLAWHATTAAKARARFVLALTMPELAEIDKDGRLRELLDRDFDLVRHLPCWVGPKDESIYVYVPKESKG